MRKLRQALRLPSYYMKIKNALGELRRQFLEPLDVFFRLRPQLPPHHRHRPRVGGGPLVVLVNVGLVHLGHGAHFIVSSAAIESIPSHRFLIRRFSFAPCWLLSKLTIDSPKVGTCSTSLNT